MPKISKKKQRIIFIALLSLISLLALLFIISNFKDNIIFFYSPSELRNVNITEGKIIRVGGLVKKGSVKNLPDSAFEFVVTDLQNELKVRYKGIKPDLFRQGQGMVAKGFLDKKNNIFIAKELLVKHDENYMPPEVAKSLKKINN